MPELPEIETIKRGLEKKIVGLEISAVEILNPKSFQGDKNEIINAKIINVWRKAKVLGINLSTANSLQSSVKSKKTVVGSLPAEVTLLFHLKMSGQIIFQSNKTKVVGGHPTKDMLGEMPNKSTRVIIHLSSPTRSGISATLYFNDQRKFGWIKVLPTDKVNENSLIKSLGPEPLEKDFTWQILKQNLSRRKSQAVKVALLDQQIVSGIGNIYACEACFNAKIHPTKKVSQLTDNDYKKLHQGIIDALTLSIEKGGSSKQHYYNEAGEKGYFLDFAYVYDRAKKPCKVCGTPIEKITINGRGTYFCPSCQR